MWVVLLLNWEVHPDAIGSQLHFYGMRRKNEYRACMLRRRETGQAVMVAMQQLLALHKLAFTYNVHHEIDANPKLSIVKLGPLQWFDRLHGNRPC